MREIGRELREAGRDPFLDPDHVPGELHGPLRVAVTQLPLLEALHLRDELQHPPLGLQQEVVVPEMATHNERNESRILLRTHL